MREQAPKPRMPVEIVFSDELELCGEFAHCDLGQTRDTPQEIKMKSIFSELVICVLLSGNCFAESKDKSLWENLKELPRGQKIQVIQWNSITFEGKFQS
jgi:hypothetical protein